LIGETADGKMDGPVRGARESGRLTRLVQAMRARVGFLVLCGAWAAGSLSIVAAPAEAAWAHLWLNSQPGDFIGGGHVSDLTYDSSQGALVLSGIRQTLPSGQPSSVEFFVAQDDLGTLASTLIFETHRLGIPIGPGYYPDAQRAGTEALGHPGLDVGFDARGCSTVTGNFTITDLTFGPGNSIEHFAASFEQHCEAQPPALFGSFTYYLVPEPTSLAGFALAGLTTLLRIRRR